VRAAAATDLSPTSASGFPYANFAANQLVRTPNVGALFFMARTNLLLNSTAPATQTTASLANGTYTLWVNGSGSATMSAGTATGCGTGAATQGIPVNFTTSGAAGTCTVTVAGSLNAFQLELGTFGTPLIVTAGATLARAADVVTYPMQFSTSSQTLYGEGFTSAPLAYTTAKVLASIDDGSTNNRLQVSLAASTGVTTLLTVGAASVGMSSAGSAVNPNVKTRMAVSHENVTTVNGNQGSADGSVVVGSTVVAVATLTKLSIGANATSAQPLNGMMAAAAVWPSKALDRFQMSGFTRP
jgi:hypothetical protein